jgi:hypothetical protein
VLPRGRCNKVGEVACLYLSTSVARARSRSRYWSVRGQQKQFAVLNATASILSACSGCLPLVGQKVTRRPTVAVMDHLVVLPGVVVRHEDCTGISVREYAPVSPVLAQARCLQRPHRGCGFSWVPVILEFQGCLCCCCLAQKPLKHRLQIYKQHLKQPEPIRL